MPKGKIKGIHINGNDNCIYADRYIVTLTGQYPQHIHVRCDGSKVFKKLFNYLDINKDLYTYKYLSRAYRSTDYSQYSTVIEIKTKIEGEIIVISIFSSSITVDYIGENDFKTVVKPFINIAKKNKIVEEDSAVSVVVQTANGYRLRRFQVPNAKININKSYNDDLQEIDEIIIGELNKHNSKGIICLHGSPGGGKTTYIRHIINRIKRKAVIFIPPNMTNMLTSPGFIDFLIENPNSILVIEDAETVLVDRKTSGNNSVADLLNISDGLLSDILNIQLVCTFNSDVTIIDQALLRKGRMIAKYEFKALDVEKCNVINAELGFPETKTPMLLADLYNQEKQSFKEETKQKIGF